MNSIGARCGVVSPAAPKKPAGPGRIEFDHVWFAYRDVPDETMDHVALFNATFGRKLTADVFQNVNPARGEMGYAISPALRKLIERHRAEDIDLYRRTQDLFLRQISRKGIFVIAGSATKPEFGVLDVPIDPAKAELVSAAIDRYDLKSIIDVGACWGVNGGYTFHALGGGKLERAVVVDGDITSLTRERAAGDARVQLLEGPIGDATFLGRNLHCAGVDEAAGFGGVILVGIHPAQAKGNIGPVGDRLHADLRR